MKKVLPNTKKTSEYLSKLPKMYLIAYWARWGITEFPFSGEYITRNGKDYPLVWDYDDHNGTDDSFYLRPIDYTTTGYIIGWTQFKNEAERISWALNFVGEYKKY